MASATTEKHEDFTPGDQHGLSGASPLSEEYVNGLPKGAVQVADVDPTSLAQAPGQTNPSDSGVTVIAKNGDQSCQPSPAYQRFIEKANNLYFVPRSLNVEAIRNRYNCLIQSDADAARFAKIEVAKIGDPFTGVRLPTDVVRALPQITGIDARFEYRQSGPLGPAGLVVAEVKENSAAKKSGLQSGDRIISANNVDLRNLEFDEAQLAMRGDKNQPVAVQVMRGDKLINLNVTRPSKDIPLTDRMLDSRTAYIKIYDFHNEDLSNQMFAALQRRQAAQAIVLDLRGNPGGLLDEAVEIAGFFMKSGTVLRTRERREGEDTYNIIEHQIDDKNIRKISTAPGQAPRVIGTSIRTPYMVAGKQVVVLVDKYSASAAEILVGALQDNDVATVVGTRTYGKGIGQLWMKDQPGNSQMFVTNFKYETPKGRFPGDGYRDKPGLKPDYEIENTTGTVYGTSRDVQLAAASMFVRPPARTK